MMIRPLTRGPDANIDAGECATLSVETHELVATVDLLVDTSGSMFQQPAPFWTPLYKALMDSTTGVVKPLEASTRFGFTSYTGLGDSSETGFKCPILQTVPYALNHYAAIDKLYGGILATYNSQAWETPTHAAIDAAAANLLAFKAIARRPEVHSVGHGRQPRHVLGKKSAVRSRRGHQVGHRPPMRRASAPTCSASAVS